MGARRIAGWGALCTLTLGLVLWAGLSAYGDVVRTKDGRVLKGTVEEVDGALVVTTPLGSVRVEASDVESWEKTPSLTDQYRTMAREIPPDDVEGHYRLGRWCETRHLPGPASVEFNVVLALNPDHLGARDALGWRQVDGQWRSASENLAAAGFVQLGGRWVLPAEKALMEEALDLPTREKEIQKALEDLVSTDPARREEARRTLSILEPEAVNAALVSALRDPRWDRRAAAARLLGEMGNPRSYALLAVRALRDTVKEVREAAVDGIRLGEYEYGYAGFVKTLSSEVPAIRLNSVRALERLGDRRSIEYLVTYIRSGGGGPRVHLALANQVSYISDFDVEVAQTSQIADPIVKVIQDGLVLDFKDWWQGEAVIVERRIVMDALRSLTGANPGNTVKAWVDWWKEHRREYEAH